MGITLILVMGMLAFIVNVGLFVKAKINLQNATDAAAYAGAATQARQLTNIAYVNWEMRNTYKEWMFKYYVLGQLGLFPYNLDETELNNKENVSFMLVNQKADAASGATFKDLYNIPSICIHNNSKTNICPIFSLPGIPRFSAIGVAGISEIHEAFVDKLAEEKGKDCSVRSKMNYLTALTWAYGSGKDDMPEAPLIATNRPGAWPQALELAMRMRNLEMIVNRPAIPSITRQTVSELQNQNSNIGINERPLKAFWSAYRNLSGGAYKDNNSNDELTRHFEMSEIAPKVTVVDPLSASGFLIPTGISPYPGGESRPATSKQYLDLQLVPLNLATMFSTFATTTVKNAGMDDVAMDATCGVSKTAMPVPGYIMGFVKNPRILTYYAVKTQSKFIGLFAPFRGDLEGGVTLTAYAAAKPFGGRIGPHLFSFDKTSNAAVLARDNDKNRRSSSYVSGLVIGKKVFEPGMPIPFDSENFWVDNVLKNIGGVPNPSSDVFYSIPNMIYDFTSKDELVKNSSGDTNIQFISSDPKKPPPKLGLYQSSQFKALKASIGTVIPGSSLSGDDVLAAIVRARRATKYDAINYLVPSFEEVSDKNNVAPIVIKKDPISQVGFTYKLFAPLVGTGLLYENGKSVEQVVQIYMGANKKAVEQYLKALLDVANSIHAISAGGTSSADTTGAAKSIHINAGIPGASPIPNLLSGASASDPSCKTDMASKFGHFFNDKAKKECDITPLVELMVGFIDEIFENPERRLYYIGLYYDENGPLGLKLKPEQLMTAFYPGERQGIGQGASALNEHPLKISSADSSDNFSTRRNFYSTKFIQLSKVIKGKTDNSGATPALVEYGNGDIPADFNGVGIDNMIEYDATNGINKNYFLDF